MLTNPGIANPLSKPLSTSIHITALDGIITVNSLFTLAVFLGLTWNPYDTSNNLLTNPPTPTCTSPSPSSTAESLITYHVYSFSSFLFSSLIALSLKQAIRFSTFSLHRSSLRLGMLASAVGSVAGSGFLMLALVDVVQIKLGALSCGSSHSLAAVVPLLILVPSGLIVYVCCVVYAFLR